MDEIPYEVVVNDFNEDKREERASLIQNAAADSWDDAEWDKKEEVNDKIEQWRKNTQQKPAETRNVDDDLFNTLEPTITSAKKVVIKPKGMEMHAPQKSSLFEFNEAKMGASSTLGEIDDDLMAWGDGDDLDSALREHRDEQNKQRQIEHERRLLEKKMQSQNQNIL